MVQLAWHYTTGEKFYQISNNHELRPSNIGVLPPEKPILWFSTNQYWENTANKATRENGEIVRLTMEETRRLGAGLVRFGVGVRSIPLHPWLKLWKKARMPREQAQQLEVVGRQQNADPSEWYGTTATIPIEKTKSLQIMDDDGNWEDVDMPW